MYRVHSHPQVIASRDSLIRNQYAMGIKTPTSALKNGLRFTLRTLYETPAEASAFALAGIIMKIFISSLAPPFVGICTSLILSRLAIKILDQYHSVSLIRIKKQVCKLNKKYPKLQLVAFISALAVSLLSETVGFIMGMALGAFGAIVLDVENYKLIQQAKRDTRLKLTLNK